MQTDTTTLYNVKQTPTALCACCVRQADHKEEEQHGGGGGRAAAAQGERHGKRQCGGAEHSAPQLQPQQQAQRALRFRPHAHQGGHRVSVARAPHGACARNGWPVM